MLRDAHINDEVCDNGFILTKWIRGDLLQGQRTLEELRKFYISDLFLIGPEERKITDDELFLAYKSAELLVKDQISFEEKRKSKRVFRRSPRSDEEMEIFIPVDMNERKDE